MTDKAVYSRDDPFNDLLSTIGSRTLRLEITKLKEWHDTGTYGEDRTCT